MSIGPVQHKEPSIVVYKQQESAFQRHVKWLQEGHGALAIIEAVALSISVIGIPLLIKAASEWKKNGWEAKFKNEQKIPPNSDLVIDLKTDRQTFNHVSDYVIKDDVIWCRRREPKGSWEPIFFDGYPNSKPVTIDADGANLIVRDDRGDVHYKKVLKEYRKEEVGPAKNRHLKDEVVDKDYIAVDKSTLNNWKSKWFSLPFINAIVNLFAGKRLHIDPTSKSCVISHRGRYNNFIEDKEGHKHPVKEGVTTLYVLSQDGREIRKYDPWSPKHADVRLYFPEADGHVFRADKIAASASTLMAVGYEGSTLKILTKLGDIDTEGWNPALKYDYFEQRDNPKVRVLPIEPDWKEHKLPEGEISDVITIIQIGDGNDSRELRVEGKKGDTWGYYKKHIRDDEWTFVATPNTPHKPLLPRTKEAEPLASTVHDYKSKDNAAVELKSFGEHSYHSTLVVEGKEIALHKRHGLASFLGFTRFSYELVLPDDANESIKKLFGSKRVLPVKVDQSGNTVTLKAGGKIFTLTL